MAHAYEEDLPSLDALKDDRRGWSVTVGSGPDAATRPGRFDQVGCIIDPNQHTAMVMGWVDNPDGRLRVGQFVTVHLEVPPPKSEVVIPAAALCEEGGRTTVFLHPEGTQAVCSPPGHRLAPQRRQGISPQPGDRGGAAARVGAAPGGPACGHVANRAVDGKLERIEIRRQVRGGQTWGVSRTSYDRETDSLGGAEPPDRGALGLRLAGLRPVCLQQHQRGGLSRPGAGHRGNRGPLSRRARRKKWNARSRSRSRWPWRGCRA